MKSLTKALCAIAVWFGVIWRFFCLSRKTMFHIGRASEALRVLEQTGKPAADVPIHIKNEWEAHRRVLADFCRKDLDIAYQAINEAVKLTDLVCFLRFFVVSSFVYIQDIERRLKEETTSA